MSIIILVVPFALVVAVAVVAVIYRMRGAKAALLASVVVFFLVCLPTLFLLWLNATLRGM